MSKTNLTVGKEYNIVDSRKGNFCGIFLGGNNNSGKFTITSGVARYLSASNPDKKAGDEIDIRYSLCKFTEVHKFIPIEKWGKDHWSTFLYIETRNVDHGGKLDISHMRTDKELHPNFAAAHSINKFGESSQKNDPTRLHGYFEDEKNPALSVKNHDDWSCVEDMVAEGLLIPEDNCEIGIDPVYKLTEKGWRISSLLRNHKGNGGMFATFKIGD